MDLILEVKRNILAKYRRFGSELANANIEYNENLKYHTAATDGKNIYVDPKYFASLTNEERMFLIAHEIMHIKFMHMYRLKTKDGEKRDLELWNIATDAIINANLQRDGFEIKEGAVNMPEALNYTAEEFYQKLLEEKEKKEQEKQQNNSNNQNQEQENNEEDGQSNSSKDGQKEENDEQKDQSEQGNDSNNEQENESNDEQNGQENDNSEQDQDSNEASQQGDDHSMWEKAFEEQQQEKSKKKSSSQEQDNSSQSQEEFNEQEDFDEREEFEQNREEKREEFRKKREKAEKNLRSNLDDKIKFDSIGESKEEIDWKLLVRREVENNQTMWSQRRSIAENNYAYRLEENDLEDEAETEVMIDVSGSVDIDLVKAFLRQLKPLLKQSKLKVGCFNEKFWGLVEIKNARDIDNFTIPKEARGNSAWTEDWDLAVRSFTKKKEINKFVFTDGYPCPGTMPKEDLKREDVTWLVYGNRNFKPCCGKVINITEKQLEKLNSIETKDDIGR